jgi:hypothetical protein
MGFIFLDMLSRRVNLVLIAALLLGGVTHADDAAAPPPAPRTLAPGQRVSLGRPLAIRVKRPDADALTGHLTAYDRLLFVLRDREGVEHDVPWSDLTPARVLIIHETLLRDASAMRWLELGEQLRAIEPEDDHTASERAIARALALDGELAPAADRLRQGEPIDPPAPALAPAPGNTPAPGNAPTPDNIATHAPLPADHGPRVTGEVDPAAWGPLTDAQRTAAIAQLQAFAEKARDQIAPRLRLFETDFFLFHTDLDESEARYWGSLLDKMYRRLAELFAVEKGRNIWKGKALIFVFRNEADYHRFQGQLHQTQSQGTAGMCHGFGDGHVHVAFFRQSDRLLFAHILVHESVHGFLHRYRSPEPIPSWINEGLAEVIAAELIPDADVVPRSQRLALIFLRNTRTLGGLFDAPHIDGWQYGLASSLTALMIRENKTGYVGFINAIKDGTPWRDALEKHYGITLNRLITYFGNQNHIRDLTP